MTAEDLISQFGLLQPDTSRSHGPCKLGAEYIQARRMLMITLKQDYGWSIVQIARRVGVHHSSVVKACQSVGLYRPKKSAITERMPWPADYSKTRTPGWNSPIARLS